MRAAPLGAMSALYWALHSSMVRALTDVPNKQTTTENSTQPVSVRVTNAGMAAVEKWSFEIP
jgi:hypothetical protein